MFNVDWRAVVLAAALLPAFAAADALTLGQALALAVQRADATRSAISGATSASEAARSAGQWPDPTLRLGVDNLPVTGADRFSTTRDAMTMKRIGIGQEWVSAEKRAARQAAADALVGKAALAVDVAVAAIRLQTALAYVDAWFADQSLALALRAEHHAREASAVESARLSSLAGSGREALASASALGIAEDASAELRQRQRAARIVLARWIGVQAGELAAPPDAATADEPAFIARHPMVLAAQRELELARREAAVAAGNRAPNWSWELSYGQRSGQGDMVSFGVSIPLPVSPAERQDREAAAKFALVDQADAQLAEASRDAQAEYQSLASDAERLAERIERYRLAVAVPTQQRTAVTLAAYRANQATLASLFEARHLELEAQGKLLSLQRELAEARARLAFKPLAFKPLTDGAAR